MCMTEKLGPWGYWRPGSAEGRGASRLVIVRGLIVHVFLSGPGWLPAIEAGPVLHEERESLYAPWML